MLRIRMLHKGCIYIGIWEGYMDMQSSRYNGNLGRMGKVMEANLFEFRIINLSDGNQVIDPTLKTPYNSLTPLQMVEYTEMDIQLAIMDRMERKSRAEAERKQKRARGIAYRLACFCGLV